MKKATKDKAIKKINIAIDKMIDLQDMGVGCEAVSRILEKLNGLRNTIENNH
jgi:hypothetical protein